MKTEHQQAYFFELYSNHNFEDLKANEQAFVKQYFSEEEFKILRETHLTMLSDIALDKEDTFDTISFKNEILQNMTQKKKQKSLFKQSIPIYKVAVMLVLALSTGLFFGQFIGKPVPTGQVQLAYQDSTHNPIEETIIYDCSDAQVANENTTFPNEIVENEIKTVSTCDIKEILKRQPKKVNNQMIDDFPLVRF